MRRTFPFLDLAKYFLSSSFAVNENLFSHSLRMIFIHHTMYSRLVRHHLFLIVYWFVYDAYTHQEFSNLITVTLTTTSWQFSEKISMSPTLNHKIDNHVKPQKIVINQLLLTVWDIRWIFHHILRNSFIFFKKNSQSYWMLYWTQNFLFAILL